MLPSYENVHNIAVTLQSSVSVGGVIIAVKGLAITLVLWNWMAEYQKLATTGKFDWFKIIWGVVYILILASCTQILSALNGFMTTVGNYMTNALPLPSSEYLLFSGEELVTTPSQTGDETADWMNAIGDFFTAANLSGIIFQIVKDFVMLFVIAIDYVFFITREGLLFLLAICFPLVMALGAIQVGENKKIPDIVWKFIRVYMGVYLLGYAYLFVIGFTSYFFAQVCMGGEWVGLGDGVNVMWLIVLLFTKYRMFSESNSTLKSIL